MTTTTQALLSALTATERTNAHAALKAGAHRQTTAANRASACRDVLPKRGTTAVILDVIETASKVSKPRGVSVGKWDASDLDVIVKIAHSHAAGNCESGTRDWIARHLSGRESATVREILAAAKASLDRVKLAVLACRVACSMASEGGQRGHCEPATHWTHTMTKQPRETWHDEHASGRAETTNQPLAG